MTRVQSEVSLGVTRVQSEASQGATRVQSEASSGAARVQPEASLRTTRASVTRVQSNSSLGALRGTRRQAGSQTPSNLRVRFGSDENDKVEARWSLNSSQSFRSASTKDDEDTEVVQTKSSAAIDILRRSQHVHTDLDNEDLGYMSVLLEAYGLREEKTEKIKDPERAPVKAFCFWVTNNLLFRMFFTLLLCLNIVLLAAEADATVHYINHTEEITLAEPFTSKNMQVAEHVFTALFTLEILVRVIGSPVPPWRDGWLLSDGIIVGFAVLDIWVLNLLQSTSTYFSSFGSFRAVRVFRALRAFRVIRILRYIRPLRLVAEALGEAFKTTSWIIVITFSVCWCTAVVMSSSVGQTSTWARLEYDSFSFCLLILPLILIRGIHWGTFLVNPLLNSGVARGVINGMLVFCVIVAMVLGFRHLLTGQFISSLLDASNKDLIFMNYKSLQSGEVSLDEMKRVFKAIDKSHQDRVTFDDFLLGIKEHPRLCQSIGMRVEKAGAYFRMMDVNRSGCVSMEEFMLGCIKIRWTSKNMDMLCTDFSTHKIFREIYDMGCSIDRDFVLTKNCIAEVELGLEGVKNGIQSLLVRLNSGELELAEIKIRRAQALGGPMTEYALVLKDLQDNFSYKTRLDELRATVRQKRSRDELDRLRGTSPRRSSPGSRTPRSADGDAGVDERPAGGEGAPAAARTGRTSDLEQRLASDAAGDRGAPAAGIEEVWSEILIEEALPWLRDHLKIESLPLTSLTKRGSTFSKSTSWANLFGVGAAASALPFGRRDPPDVVATALEALRRPGEPRRPPSPRLAGTQPFLADRQPPKSDELSVGLRPSLLTPVGPESLFYEEGVAAVQRTKI